MCSCAGLPGGVEMTSKNKDPVFAWRLNAWDKKDKSLYAYRREGWMYIFICLVLRKPLPALCVISRKFPQKIKEIEDKKDSKRFIVGVLLSFLTIPVCVKLSIATTDWFYIFMFSLCSPHCIPSIAVYVFERIDSLREKIKGFKSHTSI